MTKFAPETPIIKVYVCVGGGGDFNACALNHSGSVC